MDFVMDKNSPPNISKVQDFLTARTCVDVANQRAENLAILGVTNVIELCVGPSLKVLESCYSRYGISCSGNDIQSRWRSYYRQGRWLIGDCFKVPYEGYDCIVFAPPLSQHCTGTRDNSLQIEEVFPKYTDFLFKSCPSEVKVKVLVLPARSLATRYDRGQFFKLVKLCSESYNVDIFESTAGRRKIRKYVELYLT